MSPLAAGVRPRPGRCPYCGRPCNGATCRAHSDLLRLDAAMRDVHLIEGATEEECRRQLAAIQRAQARPVDKPVETVDE